jgi:hypothetical protein
MRFHVVSFYTGDGAYRDFAQTLMRSCDKFGVPHHVEYMTTDANWFHNMIRKPVYLLRKLREIGEPCVWLDCDCELIQRPVLFERDDVDFMCYNFAADRDNGVVSYAPGKLVASGGVVWAAPTEAGLDWIAEWGEWCARAPDKRDDVTMNEAWPMRRRKDLRFEWLPQAYNRLDSYWPKTPPVVNHVYRDGRIFKLKARSKLPDAPPGQAEKGSDS